MNAVEKYFNAEKYESVFFVIVGLTAILFSIYFLIKLKQPFYAGMVYPLVIVALIQILVGSSVYGRSPKDKESVNQLLKNNQNRIKTEEIPRMEIVMKNFFVYRWIEIALILVGLFMIF